MRAKKIPGAVVGDGKRRKRFQLGLKARLAVIASALVLILVVALGVTVTVSHFSRVKTPATPAKTATKLTTKQQAEKLAYQGSYAQAQKLLTDQLKTLTSPADKANVYIQQTTLAINEKNYVDALKYAKQADAAKPTPDTADLLAQVATKSGDIAGAKAYLNMATSRLDKSSATYIIKTRQYKSEMDGLGA